MPGRLAWLIAGMGAVPLAACVSSLQPPQAPDRCIALQSGVAVLIIFRGCATQLNAHWAVMAKHEDRLIPPGAIVDPDYDLMFFPHAAPPPRWGDAKLGEPVTAYGNPSGPAAGESRAGRVLALASWQGSGDAAPFPAVYFRGPIAPGFSGGPVVDESGAVVGMTVEMLLAPPRINRVGAKLEAGDGIALPAGLIRAEFARLGLAAAPAPARR